MRYTTTTNIARNGKKEFDAGVKVVMCNNEDIGMIRGKDYYEFFKDGTLLEEIRQEIREAKDTTTSKMVQNYEKSNVITDDSLSFEDFKKTYDL